MLKFLTFALFLAVSLPAVAAGPAAPPKKAASDDSLKDRATWLDMSSRELTGKHVVSPDGKALGEIEDLIVDLKGGHIPHVVLSFGGIADIGDKLFVLPVNAFTRDEYRDRIVVRIDPQQLKQSTGFDRAHWPFQPPLERASRLRGKNVKDADGRPAGEIEDLIVNLGSGKVRGVRFAQNGRKGDEPKQVLPLESFAKRGDEMTLTQRTQ